MVIITQTLKVLVVTVSQKNIEDLCRDQRSNIEGLGGDHHSDIGDLGGETLVSIRVPV